MIVSLEKILAKLKENNCGTESDIKYTTKLVNESLDDEGYLLPYWLKHPEIPIDSIGWRMGSGEDYHFLNRLYFQCLSNDEKMYYKQKYPKPLAKRENEV
ncbi:MAG: hypothetical protein COB41_04140 [Proteobacteria bacterium]|nr:MAG: hypothetical protein COB41_04140 [Pseudomonadota bacterium]